MNWIVRIDRVALFDRGPGSATATIVDRSRRRWRVQRGDTLLLISGRGLETVFRGLAPVADVQVVETSQAGIEHEYHIELGDVTDFTGDLSLEEMYSLTKVANFTRPFLHLRHRTAIGDEDIAAIRAKRISIGRSAYFGLLRNLEPNWRDRLELRALLRQSEHQPLGIDRPNYETAPPLKELLAVVEAAVLTPARLASQVSIDWLRLFPDESVALASTDDTSRPWQFLEFCRNAARRRSDVDQGWSEVERLLFSTASEPDPESERSWRPHRW